MTVSKSTKADLINWGIEDRYIKVINNGVYIPKKLQFVKKKGKIAIFLGAISKDKGIEKAIKVFEEINRKEQDWQFWVIGKSETKYLNYLKNLARNLGILNKITFFGYIPEDEKFDLLARAKVLVNPSIREGWGLVVIEAASVGVPTIAFNVPGLKDSIVNGKTGIICSERSNKCMAFNILEINNDNGRYNRISFNAISWSKKFSWKSSTRMSLKLLKDLITDRVYKNS